MADMQGEGKDVSKAAPVASAAAVVLGPVVKPAPVSWMTPTICSSETGSDSTPLKRQKSADTFPVEKNNESELIGTRTLHFQLQRPKKVQQLVKLQCGLRPWL